MKSKTASVRLPTEMFEEIDEVCDGIGCSRNDWIKDTLQEKLREENSQDQDIKSEEPPKEEPKPTLEPIVEDIPEIENPKIVEEPLDNSKKPVIEMVEFNGKYIPKAEVFEI